jgi:hypothetical protein
MGLGAGALVALAALTVSGQEGATGGGGPALRRGDSVTLDLGRGGSGRVTLPGGDAVVPGDGAVLRTLTDLDVEGAARTTVLLEGGQFELEGRGGGPRIRVLGLELLPGSGNSVVTVDGTTARVQHANGGPLVVRLGGSPDAARIVLTEGGAIDLTRTGDQVAASVVGGGGRVLLAEARGWSTLSPGAQLQAGADAREPAITAGEAVGGAHPPEIPAPETVSGSEQVAARVGDGGRAAVFLADGSGARAEAGAEIVARWSGGPSDRQATLATTAGTAHVTLRTPRATAETPGHRVSATDAAALTLTVSSGGERFAVDRDGSAATLRNVMPHPGPAIELTVGPGDAVEYVAGDPAQGITYRVAAGNAGPVTFTVGTKRLRAEAGTEVTFRPDGQVEVTWPEGPEELFRFAFAPETLLPSVSVPYTGLPDLLPPPPVSPFGP